MNMAMRSEPMASQNLMVSASNKRKKAAVKTAAFY
jgi:hypothetical protein